MTSSLDRGIEAAKSGLMEDALNHLKDAIVEEPENANVWVWLSAIIEDEEKQTIFLKKALEIDPGNRPAQRGLAFIERKKYIPPKPGEKLSDYTRPIGVVKQADAVSPSQAAAHISAQNPAPEPVAVAASAPSKPASQPTVAPKAKKRKPWLDILLYGITLMVFIVIGILIGSTLLNIDIPFLSKPVQVLKVLPGSNGVFLLENEQYSKMDMNQAIPEDLEGIPETIDIRPDIVVYTPVINTDRLELRDESDNLIPFELTPAESNSYLLVPTNDLIPGRYCLVYSLNPSKGENLYWCLLVSEN